MIPTQAMGTQPGVCHTCDMPNWTRIRDQLWERSRGRCEVSGIVLDRDTFDAHHRRNKGMGGTSRPDVDDLDNLLALDPVIHNGGPQSVHGRRPWAQERGYLISKLASQPPGAWPIWLHGRRWVLLDKAGGYVPLPESQGHVAPG